MRLKKKGIQVLFLQHRCILITLISLAHDWFVPASSSFCINTYLVLVLETWTALRGPLCPTLPYIRSLIDTYTRNKAFTMLQIFKDDDWLSFY